MHTKVLLSMMPANVWKQPTHVSGKYRLPDLLMLTPHCGSICLTGMPYHHFHAQQTHRQSVAT